MGILVQYVSQKSIKNGFPIRKGKKSASQLFDCDEKMMIYEDDDKHEHHDEYDDVDYITLSPCNVEVP